MKISESIATLNGLNNDHSNTQDSRRLRRRGWTQVPVVDFDGTLYAILWHDTPHPGHNTAEVINVSEFGRRGSRFRIAVTVAGRKNHTEGWAWVRIGEGLSILTLYQDDRDNESLYEYAGPATAVLSYRIEPPKREDIDAVEDTLDEELQEGGLSWPMA